MCYLTWKEHTISVGKCIAKRKLLKRNILLVLAFLRNPCLPNAAIDEANMCAIITRLDKIAIVGRLQCIAAWTHDKIEYTERGPCVQQCKQTFLEHDLKP